MILCGAFYGVLNCGPSKKTLVEKYPILGVLAFFYALGITYWLLTTVEKDLWQAFAGVLTVMATFLVVFAVGNKICKE